VLSSLTLGLAVDFAIHFLARAREMHREFGSWGATAPAVFGAEAHIWANDTIQTSSEAIRIRGDVVIDLETGDFSEFQDLVSSCRKAWEAGSRCSAR